jgi:hypothetical protein
VSAARATCELARVHLAVVLSGRVQAADRGGWSYGGQERAEGLRVRLQLFGGFAVRAGRELVRQIELSATEIELSATELGVRMPSVVIDDQGSFGLGTGGPVRPDAGCEGEESLAAISRLFHQLDAKVRAWRLLC